MGVTRDLFIHLSQNKLLNTSAKRWGLKLGARSVVAGTTVKEMIKSVLDLNALGISCTIDNLGEFVYEKEEAIEAKTQILKVIEAIYEHDAKAHISLKPTQIGLDIDYDFCLTNLTDIVEAANNHNIFINVDMEDHAHLHQTFDLINTLKQKYKNIGTVIQAYLFRAEEDIKNFKESRLRIVKGAYKESEKFAFQNKKEIDQNYLRLIEYHLLHGRFTSIATHNHHVINHVKQFVKENNIALDKFEFQMLYGFRKEMQLQLAKEGYNFCTYVPFGSDWYGYFMRRLAERPQNLNLVANQVFNKRVNTIIGVCVGALLLGELLKKTKG